MLIHLWFASEFLFFFGKNSIQFFEIENMAIFSKRLAKIVKFTINNQNFQILIVDRSFII